MQSVLALLDRTSPSKAHLSGASALIKLRGDKNFNNLLSQKMLAGVYSEIVSISSKFQTSRISADSRAGEHGPS
jgi:hypothetical protein